MTFKDVFTPALYQPPSKWYPGGDYVPMVGRKLKPAVWDCPNWLDPRLKGTPGYYPHALISYYTWHLMPHPPFPKESFLFGDSGGFSIMTKGASIDPRDVLRWQIQECTVGAILDVPPSNRYGERIFHEGLARTQKHVALALPEYREHGGRFKWWGVIQGWDWPSLAYWYDGIRRVYEFAGEGEGWALKPRPNITAETTARTLGFVSHHPEIKRAHLLMTTGVKAVAVMICLGARAGLEFVSYDSTTAAMAATNRSLMTAIEGIEWRQGRELGEEHHLRDFILQTCPCASCKAARQDAERFPDFAAKTARWSGYWVFRFAYHNLLTMLQVFQNVRQAAAGDPDALLRRLLLNDYGAVMRAYEHGYVDVAQEPSGTHVSLLERAADDTA